MMFQDKFGRLWYPHEVGEMSLWEIEESGIHVEEC